jgi:DNA-binding response OmpR family regulator
MSPSSSLLCPGTVLLFDGEPPSGRLLARQIEAWGIPVDRVEDVEELLAAVQAFRYELVILDGAVLQGGINVQQLSLLNRYCLSVPLAALLNAEHEQQVWLQLGINAFLMRPVNPADLRLLLAHYLPDAVPRRAD